MAMENDNVSLLRSALQVSKFCHEMCQKVLVDAVARDKVHVVLDLLRSFPNAVQGTSTSGPSPLHITAKSGSMALLGMLLASPSTNIDAINEEGYTALALAVQTNRVEVAALLLSVGATASIPLPDGSSVLHVAATRLDSTMLLALLKAPGTAINQRDQEGYTVLARAVVAGRDAVAELLLDAGADVWVPLPNKMTVLAAAVQHGRREMAQILYERMYPRPPTLAAADDVTIVERIARQRDVDIYKATYKDKMVVLKGVRYALPRLMEQMRNEVNEMQTCTSPYVQPLIAILDNGSTTALLSRPNGDKLYSPTMVIEYMDGGDLDDTLKKIRSGLDVPLQVSTIEVALVLAYALKDLHALGKVHRDIKSLNIFLSTTHYIRLADLGSARTLNNGLLTSNPGTPLWDAPEVVRVDIYSFGVVLTELDTREKPYADVDDTRNIRNHLMDQGVVFQHHVNKGKCEHVEIEITAMQVAWAVANALDVIHSLGKVHRDVKSLNIFLSSIHGIKLGDFGTAPTVKRNMTMHVGTPLWIAPEVLRASSTSTEQAYGTAADIYSFGIVLSELATGNEPYGALLGDRNLVQKIRDNGLRPDLGHDCPRWLWKLATACWTHEPSTRPTAKQIVKYLAKRLDDLDDPEMLESINEEP
ncbi:TKL protein kinase [Saprolegnia parasitica CBS 223.65]|uniref:TKL protein kinase n=1 Tax=Saprolegnia parasitica (strain CBS 223.65) TaxID=695850 RepID=A0A067BWI6_SAPPC|nr:TKL protein kinase [Saprolegnia parasitica CBS 223.65]KDO22638.1 TKL protein kinase [Saprolegnia parasitica CBS 223.65]|eukprot:XP_012206647.1 TKL protein kinase [Saprolegnia parasitica CBS 223.65]